MATLVEIAPPIASLVGIVVMESFFPEDMFVGRLMPFKSLLGSDQRFTDFCNLVKAHGKGWQAIVDLVYAFFASFLLLLARGISRELDWGPVVISSIVLMLINIWLFSKCLLSGTIDAVEIPHRVLLMRLSWRSWSLVFCYAANLTIIAAVAYELCKPKV